MFCRTEEDVYYDNYSPPWSVWRPGLLPGGEVQGLQARHGVAHTVEVDAVPVVWLVVVASVQVLTGPVSPKWDWTAVSTSHEYCELCVSSRPDTVDLEILGPEPGLVAVVGVRQLRGEGHLGHVVGRAGQAGALAGGVRAWGGAGVRGGELGLGEAAGVGRAVQGPGASQLGGQVLEVAQVEGPRDLGREGGGGRVGGEVGGAHRLVETLPGAGRRVGLILHTQQLLDPLAKQGGTPLSLLTYSQHDTPALSSHSSLTYLCTAWCGRGCCCCWW